MDAISLLNHRPTNNMGNQPSYSVKVLIFSHESNVYILMCEMIWTHKIYNRRLKHSTYLCNILLVLKRHGFELND